ncbi:hypothetical protein GCM10009836_24610 [Pseudonocardia ailaonensis]|uniref:SnoaL-like domain-containing protein n=1 Tax=Pseudonocardia ailaonensis TaxID=367279 RepID=A0ABN2MYF1_9PSEU
MTDDLRTRLLVADLLARIAQAADLDTLEEYGELLAEDIVWVMPENPATGLPAQRREGRADVLAGARERRASGLQGPGSGARHLVSTIVVTPSGDQARARSYFQFVGGGSGTPVLLSTGVYEDRFVRSEGGGWLLAERRITLS